MEQILVKNHQQGVTLVEVLIVVVLIAITLSMAVPAWQGMTARNRIVTQANDMLLAINLARSEALRIGNTVSVMAISPVGGDEFGLGWCVVYGKPGDTPEPSCTDDDVVRIFGELSGDSTLGSVENVTSLQFGSLGELKNIGTDDSRSFDLCTYGQAGSRIYINVIGRAESNKADAANPDSAKDPIC